MRKLSFDPYEFDPPSSEQFLELAISRLQEHRDLETFLKECGASATSGRPVDPGWNRWQGIGMNLESFAGLSLPPFDECVEIVLLSDDWDDTELAIKTAAHFVWYHWYTTA